MLSHAKPDESTNMQISPRRHLGISSEFRSEYFPLKGVGESAERTSLQGRSLGTIKYHNNNFNDLKGFFCATEADGAFIFPLGNLSRAPQPG